MDMRTTLTIIIIVIIIILGGWLYLSDTTPEQNEIDNEPDIDIITPADADDEETTEAEPADVHTVTYTDDGFTPQTVTIAEGETVRFVNESSRDMWVASDVHPTHAAYDGTTLAEHCEGNESTGALDQCATGDAFTFTFEQTGEWDYHNHMRTSHGGTVIVE